MEGTQSRCRPFTREQLEHLFATFFISQTVTAYAAGAGLFLSFVSSITKKFDSCAPSFSSETGISYGFIISLLVLTVLVFWGTWEQRHDYNWLDVLTIFIGFIVGHGVNAILLFGFGTVFGKGLMTVVAMTIGALVFVGWLVFEDYRVRTFYRPIRVINGG